jgi:hypothetical protein
VIFNISWHDFHLSIKLNQRVIFTTFCYSRDGKSPHEVFEQQIGQELGQELWALWGTVWRGWWEVRVPRKVLYTVSHICNSSHDQKFASSDSLYNGVYSGYITLIKLVCSNERKCFKKRARKVISWIRRYMLERWKHWRNTFAWHYYMHPHASYHQPLCS